MENKKTKWYSLGGLEEVGKNCYCIEHEEEIIMIDCGVKMPQVNDIGYDTIIPDFRYIKENNKKFVGIFITHGHEDHIGAIPWLIKQATIPKIYAPIYATELIKRKLKYLKNKNLKIPEIFEINKDFTIETKYFKIRYYINVHSIPDSFGIIIETPNGIIVTTGDYKFDLTPLGPKTEFHKLSEIGLKGVTLLLSDSTNSMVDGTSISEKMVIKNLKNVIMMAKGRVLFSTFSSNVYRLQQVINIATELNKKILIFGRSMNMGLEASLRLGYIKCQNPDQVFIKPIDAKKYPLNKILIVCTGSQGEEMAVLSRISSGSHREIKINYGDTIIFSSNPIPGNYLPIKIMINKLLRQGANVITNSKLNPLHTSGHANRDDQKLLFSLIKPKYFTPIHGEYSMFVAHKQTAIETNIKEENVNICKNGEILIIDKGTVIKSKNTVLANDIYVNGSKLSIIDDLRRERLLLAENGFIACIFSFSLGSEKLLVNPIIISRGTFFVKNNSSLVYRLQKDLYEKINECLKNKQKLEEIKKTIINYSRFFIMKRKQRNPLIIPIYVKPS